MQKKLTVIPSLAVELHLQHGIFQTIYFNLETPPLVPENFIVEAISFTCSIPQTIQTKVSPCSCLLITFLKATLRFQKRSSFFSPFSHVLNAWCRLFAKSSIRGLRLFLKVFHPWISWLQLSLYNSFDFTHELNIHSLTYEQVFNWIEQKTCSEFSEWTLLNISGPPV